jgi:aminomethyltransferase
MPASPSQAPRTTPLAAVHRDLGASMTDFAGWLMPLRYGSETAEHNAVRATAGLFDLSHMGELFVTGDGAAAALDYALVGEASAIQPGRARYTMICAADGGVLDDLVVYRQGEQEFLVIANAANTAVVSGQLAGRAAGYDAAVADATGDYALIAVQGPAAAGILGPLAGPDLGAMKYYAGAFGDVAGRASWVARTGYTGEDGFELFVAAAHAAGLFSAILEQGRVAGLAPCGLGARDTLRLEAGLPLYGHELDPATSPIEAGLDSFVKLGRPFVGESALRAQRERGPKRRLIGLETDDARSIARQGYRLLRAGRESGVVTSGTLGPSIGRPIAMGYLTGGEAGPHGAGALEVEIRGRRVPASVVALPFYRRAAVAA